jgi:hypothetical protein
MSYFTDEYIRAGYKDIVIVDSSEEEKGDWHGTEKHYETAVARRGDNFVQLRSYEMKEFGPGGSHDLSIAPAAITRKEYEAAAKGRKVVDTPEVRARFEKWEKDARLAETIKSSLEGQAPECEDHTRKMRLVRGPKQYFWGCPKYPKCRNIKWLSDDQKKIAKKLDKLPTLP